jgi:hypothetical protein
MNDTKQVINNSGKIISSPTFVGFFVYEVVGRFGQDDYDL